MNTETNRIKSKLSTLGDSIDDLEALLEPLFAQTLPETVVGLETIQQAKLQVVLPYLVYDLIFIYLKSKGIDPKTHPVVTELDRVRHYFDKIKNAEESNKKRLGVDKAAAGRFIKHAIAQSKYGGRPPGDNAEPTDVHVPVRVTSKMIERAQYEKELEEIGSEEEEDLQMFDEAPEGLGENENENEKRGVAEEIKSSKAKGKQKAVDVDVDEEIEDDMQVGAKRRRARMDPFAGYGDGKADTPKKTKTAFSADPQDVGVINLSSIPNASTTDSKSKEAKKIARKIARKKAKLPFTG